jgi:PAS domain S-box-containing protein
MDAQESAAFAASIQYADEAVVYTTGDGVIVAWSAGAERMFGYTADEARGLSIGILYPAGAWSGSHRYAAGFSAESRESGAVLVRKDGASVEVRSTAFQVPGPDGAPRALGTIYRDIGADRRAERRLVSRDVCASLLQTLVHVANEAENPQSAIAECLRLVCRQYGWALGHAVVFAPYRSPGVPALALHYTGDAARFGEFVALAATADYSQPGGGIVGDVLARRTPVWVPDLRWHGCAARSAALLEAGVRAAYAFPVIAEGEVLAVLEFYGNTSRPPEDAFVENIGRVSRIFARMIERQRSADEKAHLAAIVEGANDAIIGRTLDGIITSWNPAAERLFGYSAAEAIGQPIAMTLPPERRFLVQANNETLRRGERIPPLESPRVRRDGTLVRVSANVSPVRDAQGRITSAAVILREVAGPGAQARAADSLPQPTRSVRNPSA